MNLSRRAWAVGGLGVACAACVPRLRAEPNAGRLHVLVAQPAGGVTDIFARALAPALGRELGRVPVVENVAGASGSRAALRLLAAPPDGATLLLGSPSETVLAPLSLRAVRYQATDFRLLGLINDSPLALYARPDLPASGLDELVRLAQRRGERPLSYGSTGQGSLFHLVTERLLAATGMRATHVPYRGGMPLVSDLRSGSIDFTLLPVDALLGSMVASGQMKVLGVCAAQRLARYPLVETLDESRAAPAIGHPSIWVGLFAAAALDGALAAQLHRGVAAALGDARVRAAIGTAGGAVPPGLSLAAWQAFYAEHTHRLQALAKAAHVQPI